MLSITRRQGKHVPSMDSRLAGLGSWRNVLKLVG
jgi:hypothetical protein